MTVDSTPGAHLGIDLGTSSVKAVLVGQCGEPVASAEAGYDVRRPHPGWAETDSSDWWAATRAAVAQALAQAPDVHPLGIGLSGQMHGVVATREDGTAARDAVLWADTRAQEQLRLYDDLQDEARTRLANPLSPGMAGPILAWLVRHDPEVVASMRWALQPKDWLRLQLTGTVASEPSDASATLMYDVAADRWAIDVVEALGVDPRVLPPLLPSAGSCAGGLTAAAAAALGLPQGLPVAAGAADTAAAALGSGLVETGTAQLTIGTGVQIVTPVDQPPAGTAAPVTHHYRAATDAGHYRMAAVLNGGLALSWVRETLNASWTDLYAAAEQPVRHDDPLFLPHLNGERTPYLDPHLRGAWTGLAPHHRREDLLRSALEGVALATAEGLDALFPDGRTVDHLRLAGGGTAAPAWRQLLADVLDIELRAISVPGASGRGAALLGARACGALDEHNLVRLAAPEVTAMVRPRPGTRPVHIERRDRFRATVGLLGRRGAAPPPPRGPD